MERAQQGARLIPLPKAHEDARRAIFEADCGLGNVARVTPPIIVKGSAELGNHYHAALTEAFILASGNAEFVSQSVSAAGDPIGLCVRAAISAPMLVIVPPFVAHRFAFTGPGVLIQLSDQSFDRADIHPHQLV